MTVTAENQTGATGFKKLADLRLASLTVCPIVGTLVKDNDIGIGGDYFAQGIKELIAGLALIFTSASDNPGYSANF